MVQQRAAQRPPVAALGRHPFWLSAAERLDRVCQLSNDKPQSWLAAVKATPMPPRWAPDWRRHVPELLELMGASHYQPAMVGTAAGRHDSEMRLVARGAPDRPSPDAMGLASLGLAITIFCDSLHSVLLLNAVLGVDFLGRALCPGRRSRGSSGTPVRTCWTGAATGRARRSACPWRRAAGLGLR